MMGSLRKQVDDLLQQNIIAKSIGIFTSPDFVVPKKDGTGRLVVDFSATLNRYIARTNFPIPSIDDLLMGIVPGMIFSILDVKSGFFHVMLDPESRQFTGFSLPFGTYEFLRLPMGVSCAPEAFQSMMHHLLGHLSFVRIYIDDILVMSRNMDEHSIHLRQVFQILSDNCIKLNKKCEIAKKQIKYLGFMLNSEGLQPDPAKVDDLLKLPRPKTRRQVRSVLGALNFFRRFIPQLSSVLQPLTRLTSEKVKFQWTTIEEAALIQATESLAKASLLVYPDFQQAFHIMTDASDYGIGGVVFQIKNDTPQPIYFYSRKLSESQIRQSIVRKKSWPLN
eukprot:NODE_265_length_11346_cov_0.635814.p2 type:complete len:335 gc:universal NODE_265_length_11346_cov_0.635814:5518-4514(-)